jgi:hypothetical protein
MSSDLPNFLVVGAMNAGTTAIFHYLSQHRDIFIPDPEMKECSFFSNLEKHPYNPFKRENDMQNITNLDDYKRLFAFAEKKMKGDISPDYLYYYQDSIANIISILGKDVKIIIVLRDPVERAYSNYFHHRRSTDSYYVDQRRDQRFNLSFEEYLAAEDQFPEETTYYWLPKKTGLYYNAVAAYLDAFPNIEILFFEDYVRDTISAMSEIFGFLGLVKLPSLEPPFNDNATGVIKSQLLQYILIVNWPGRKSIKRLLSSFVNESMMRYWVMQAWRRNLSKPSMTQTTRTMLENYYYNDVECLQKLLKRPVPWIWHEKLKSLKT